MVVYERISTWCGQDLCVRKCDTGNEKKIVSDPSNRGAIINCTDLIIKNSELEEENKKLRYAAKLITKRKTMTSGGLAMAECDRYCKSLGLRPWIVE